MSCYRGCHQYNRVAYSVQINVQRRLVSWLCSLAVLEGLYLGTIHTLLFPEETFGGYLEVICEIT